MNDCLPGRQVVSGGAAWNGASVAASAAPIFRVTSPGKIAPTCSPAT